MTMKEAYSLGVDAGYSAAIYTERGPSETWEEAAYESEINARQYAGHFSEDLRTESQWDAYERGVTAGIRRGLKARGVKEEETKMRKNVTYVTSGIQSFHFPKAKWILAEAKRWLKSHGYKTGQRVDEPHFVEYRFRQEPPGKFKRTWKVSVRSRTFRKILYMLRGHLK